MASKSESGSIDDPSQSSADTASRTAPSGDTGYLDTSSHTHEELAARETKTVRKLRFLVILVLLALAVIASLLIYVFSRSSERSEFENEFQSAGYKVISGFQEDFLRKLQAMDSLSKSVTAHAADTNATWPYVTVPSTTQLFQPYLDLTNAASLTVMPLVPSRERANWEAYTLEEQGWIDRALQEQKIMDGEGEPFREATRVEDKTVDENQDSVSRFIHNYVGIDTSPGPWPVWWQYAPVISNRYFINFNRKAMGEFRHEVEAIMKRKAIFSAAATYVPGLDFQSTRDYSFMNELLFTGGNGDYQPGEPIGYLYYPIFESFEGKTPVGILMATVYWKSFFDNILSSNMVGVVCVVENSLGQKFTYKLSGKDVQFLGMDDLHDPQYENQEIAAGYETILEQADRIQYHGVEVDDVISYSIRVYPSEELEAEYMTDSPVLYSCGVFLVFLLAVVVFILYDCYVERRQKIVLNTAIRSTAVVSSLFPEDIKNRLMSEVGGGMERSKQSNPFRPDGDAASDTKSRPICDLFPETTIMFADMVGFTAWSSSREPVQVFTLLETIYQAFDEIARRRRVFKVETIGDCYVAVAGLPVPRKDHAQVMCKFANDCLLKMMQLCCKLETTLGPDTADLNLRLGLHSGPVTAGVLRGDKGRFQLFGDTMNTASRMESTSLPGKIQLSIKTAELLIDAGREEWVREREDQVVCKGKGAVKTFFLSLHSESDAGSTPRSTSSSASLDGTDDGSSRENNLESSFVDDNNSKTIMNSLPITTQRLVKWNADILLKQLKLIIARRESSGKTAWPSLVSVAGPEQIHGKAGGSSTVLEEVQDTLKLPCFDAKVHESPVDPNKVSVPPKVATQLLDFVARIASMHNANPFHSFYHASHVTMSVSKLLSRIVHPNVVNTEGKLFCAEMHALSFGITSDPLTQFACIISALIHDVEHPGVPNATLVRENHPLADKYKKSVAEQNSVQCAWELFMDPNYEDLRTCICSTSEELKRLRQTIVNMVMATDIMDNELGAARKERWEKAFRPKDSIQVDVVEDRNRKATIVLEHLIQASDVAHTMQHFTVFLKWNEKLFVEMYQAFLAGRSGEKDPSKFWYEGELGFFDFYIIPLARKLEKCGVFGVSSDEYLNYAEANRQEWADRGQEIVQKYLSRFQQMHGATIAPGKESDSMDC